MARLNLTLDHDTYQELDRCAKRSGMPRARVAREILREGIARREALVRRKKLAKDYAADRGDARRLVAELEHGQFELMNDEEA